MDDDEGCSLKIELIRGFGLREFSLREIFGEIHLLDFAEGE